MAHTPKPIRKRQEPIGRAGHRIPRLERKMNSLELGKAPNGFQPVDLEFDEIHHIWRSSEETRRALDVLIRGSRLVARESEH